MTKISAGLIEDHALPLPVLVDGAVLILFAPLGVAGILDLRVVRAELPMAKFADIRIVGAGKQPPGNVVQIITTSHFSIPSFENSIEISLNLFSSYHIIWRAVFSATILGRFALARIHQNTTVPEYFWGIIRSSTTPPFVMRAFFNSALTGKTAVLKSQPIMSFASI